MLLAEKRIPVLRQPTAVSLPRGRTAEPRSRAAAGAVLRAGGAPRTPALRGPPHPKTLRGAKRRPRWLSASAERIFPSPPRPRRKSTAVAGGKRHPPARHRSAREQLASPQSLPSNFCLIATFSLP